MSDEAKTAATPPAAASSADPAPVVASERVVAPQSAPGTVIATLSSEEIKAANAAGNRNVVEEWEDGLGRDGKLPGDYYLDFSNDQVRAIAGPKAVLSEQPKATLTLKSGETAVSGEVNHKTGDGVQELEAELARRVQAKETGTTVVDASSVASESPYPVSKDDPNAKKKLYLRSVLAAQPHRGYPAFEDLLAIADALIDGTFEAPAPVESAEPATVA